MKCKLTFFVGDEKVSLDLKSDSDSILVDNDIIEVLNENPKKREELIELLESRLSKPFDIKKVTLDNVLKIGDDKDNKGILLGNCDVSYLKSQFPTLRETFPDGVNIPVLLIKNLTIGNKFISGRVINSRGQELFVIDGEIESVEKLANYLQCKKLFEDGLFNFSEDSDEYKQLSKVLKEKNKAHKIQLKNISEMMLDFFYDSERYDKIYITVEEGKPKVPATKILRSAINFILDYSNRKDYDDDCINDLNWKINHKYGKNQDKKFLRMGSLYGSVKTFYPELLKTLELSTEKKFESFFRNKSENIKNSLKKVFDEQYIVDGIGFKTLIKYLFSKDKTYPLNLIEVRSNGLVFESQFKNNNAKYGIDYEAIHSYDILENDYYGYKIYSKSVKTEEVDDDKKPIMKTEYFISRIYLIDTGSSEKVNSLEDAKKRIKERVLKESLRKNSFVDFKFRNYADDPETHERIYDDELDSFELKSSQNFTVKSTIESIDVPLIKVHFEGIENELIHSNDSNLQKFYNLIDSWNIGSYLQNQIKLNINTAEKAMIFLYKINELLGQVREGKEAKFTISKIIKLINNAPRKAYYIESFHKTEKHYNRYRVIPTSPNHIEQYKKQKSYPTICLLYAIKKEMSKNFNVEVNLESADSIKKLFPDIDVNTAKAFIRNGKIYVNTTIAQSTDLIHEYIHIILGVLKSNPELRSNYEQLMQLIINTDEGKKKYELFKTIYPDSSYMDVREEVFADSFSNYVMNTLNPSEMKIFKSNEKIIKDTTQAIFNTEIEDLQSFYSKSAGIIFGRFSKDISKMLETQQIDFEALSKSRKISNWISKKIKEGEIKENCHE